MAAVIEAGWTAGLFPHLPPGLLKAFGREQLRVGRQTLRRTSLWILAIIFLTLPFLGWAQAESVRSCRPASIGQLALFDFRGDPAAVEGVTSTALLPSDKLFYLGTTGDKFVLYNCMIHRSVTVENKDGIVVSVGE
jgi:hypothetical protein